MAVQNWMRTGRFCPALETIMMASDRVNGCMHASAAFEWLTCCLLCCRARGLLEEGRSRCSTLCLQHPPRHTRADVPENAHAAVCCPRDLSTGQITNPLVRTMQRTGLGFDTFLLFSYLTISLMNARRTMLSLQAHSCSACELQPYNPSRYPQLATTAAQMFYLLVQQKLNTLSIIAEHGRSNLPTSRDLTCYMLVLPIPRLS